MLSTMTRSAVGLSVHAKRTAAARHCNFSRHYFWKASLPCLSPSDQSQKRPLSISSKFLQEQSTSSDNSSNTPPATPTTNRWLMLLPAFAAHVCIGAPYGWSAISGALSREFGFVSPAAADWALDLCSYPMSVMLVASGLSAALSGKWAMRVGVNRAMTVGGAVYGSGLALSGVGVGMHSLPLLYAGNILSGLGYGIVYMPPIQALLEWFPDRRGLASGAVISGFGCGALVFSPAASALSLKLAQMPEFLGAALETVTKDGRLFEAAGAGREVVFATASELSKLPYPGLSEGFYAVGTGGTGVAVTLGVIGAAYAASIAACAAAIRRPPAGYLPPGYTPPDPARNESVVRGNVHVDSVMRTPQFYLMFGTAVLLGTGGMGLMAVAKPMVAEIFAGAMPHVVTPSFASAYLMALAGGNLLGRLLWASLSDVIGRRNTFHAFAFGAAGLFLAMPHLIEGAIADPTSASAKLFLGAFCASTVATLSVMGGTFACMPAYEADLWGPKYVQAIHGRFLVAPGVATIIGPALLLNLRKGAENNAMQDLLAKVDPDRFRETFGAGLDAAPALAEAKTLTVSKLVQIAPSGVADPSPLLYHSTLQAMACLAGVAAVLHFCVRPVDQRFFEKVEEEGKEEKKKEKRD